MLRGRFVRVKCVGVGDWFVFFGGQLLLFVYRALDIRKEVGKKRYGDMFCGEKVGHSVSFWGGIPCKQAL